MWKKCSVQAFVAATLAAAGSGGVAHAESEQLSLDEITITAQRREENIQDVPLSVSAISAAQLEAAGITNLMSLSGNVPGFVAMPGLTAGRSMPVYAIRGQSQQEGTILADPSVTLYFNEIAQPRSQGSNIGFFDLAGIEVVKGPQGTLFGRNTTGGAVIVRPQRPKDTFEALVQQSFGNHGAAVTDLVLNTPLSDAASLRLAGQYTRSDGYLTDVNTGKLINDVKEIGARASLAVHPSDSWESILTLNYAKADNGGTGGLITALPPLVSAGLRALQTPLLNAQAARDIYHTASGVPMFNKIETRSIENITTIPLREGLRLKNVFGWRDVDFEILDDTDGTPSLILTVHRIDTQKQISEELQLLGENGNLEWIAGLFYFRESGNYEDNSAGAATGAGTVDPGLIEPFTDLRMYAPNYSSTWMTARNTSYAAFVQGTYSFTDALSLTVGVRQNWDKREATFLNRAFQGAALGFSCRFTLANGTRPTIPNCALPASASFSEPTYNVSLNWKPSEDALLYVAHRHGYRTGGFGPRATTEAGLRRTFEPEIVDDIEIGAKADWRIGNSLLRTSLAIYNADYEDIQRLLTDPTLTPITTVTTNAGKARVRGGELEVTWKPAEWMELSGFWGYIDAKFTEFTAPDGTDLSTAPFARAPRNTNGLNATFRLPIPETAGELSLHAGFRHIDRYASSDTFDPTAWVENYDLANASLVWRSVAGSQFDATVFVDNLFDAKYLLAYQQIGQVNKAETPGAPRMYGLRVAYRFGE